MVGRKASHHPERDGLLGEHAPGVSISAQKSMLGHTLGAAGAIEAIAYRRGVGNLLAEGSLKAAKTLGLTVPPGLLLRANEVID